MKYNLYVDNLLSDLWDDKPVVSGGFDLIYIDPPYNTGREFNYTDNRDQREYALLVEKSAQRIRENLSEDGWAAVQIDDRELITWRMALDKELGADNFVNCIVVKMSELSGVKMSHVDLRLPKLKEYILLYRKSIHATLNPVCVHKSGEKLDKYLKYYNKMILNPEDPVEEWKILDAKVEWKLNGYPEITLNEFKLDNADRMIYRTNSGRSRGMEKNKFVKAMETNGNKWYLWEGKELMILSDYLTENLGDLWTDISTINLASESHGLPVFKNGQKPIKLLERIIEMTTLPGDKVLDFFAGSGTTGCAAIRCGREAYLFQKFEMMNESESDTRPFESCGIHSVAQLASERMRRELRAQGIDGPLNEMGPDPTLRFMKAKIGAAKIGAAKHDART